MIKVFAVTAALVGSMLASVPAQAQKVAEPPALACKDDPLFRQFDFSVGTWEVFRGETKTAEVTMTPILDGCAILENWKRPNGDGIGLFTYSRVLKAWTYSWASDKAAATFFVGAVESPGRIAVTTKRPGENGVVRERTFSLTLKPDGTIHEESVGTEDGGKTWIREFELFWKKKTL
jgi:hypothetical protein